MADNRSIITAEGTLCFPHLFEKHKANANAEPRHEAMIVFDQGEDLAALNALAIEAMNKKFPGGKPEGFRSPFVDGGTKTKYGEPFESGRKCITARSKFQPGMVDASLQPILNEKDLYPGCRVRFQVHAYGYDTSGNRGVAFGLDNVQKVRDGEPLGGRVKAEEAFEAVPGAVSSAPAADGGAPAAGGADDLL